MGCFNSKELTNLAGQAQKAYKSHTEKPAPTTSEAPKPVIIDPATGQPVPATAPPTTTTTPGEVGISGAPAATEPPREKTKEEKNKELATKAFGFAKKAYKLKSGKKSHGGGHGGGHGGHAEEGAAEEEEVEMEE